MHDVIVELFLIKIAFDIIVFYKNCIRYYCFIKKKIILGAVFIKLIENNFRMHLTITNEGCQASHAQFSPNMCNDVIFICSVK